MFQREQAAREGSAGLAELEGQAGRGELVGSAGRGELPVQVGPAELAGPVALAVQAAPGELAGPVALAGSEGRAAREESADLGGLGASNGLGLEAVCGAPRAPSAASARAVAPPSSVRVVRRAAPFTKIRWPGVVSKDVADFRVAVAVGFLVAVAVDFRVAAAVVVSEVAVAVAAGAEEVENDDDGPARRAAIPLCPFRSNNNVSHSASRTEDCRDNRSNLRDR